MKITFLIQILSCTLFQLTKSYLCNIKHYKRPFPIKQFHHLISDTTKRNYFMKNQGVGKRVIYIFISYMY